MEKYIPLINKKINLVFNDQIINSYKITMIGPSKEVEGIGKVLKCQVEWDNKELADNVPRMDFDVKTLDDLVTTGQAICPFLAEIIFKIDLLNYNAD